MDCLGWFLGFRFLVCLCRDTLLFFLGRFRSDWSFSLLLSVVLCDASRAVEFFVCWWVLSQIVHATFVHPCVTGIALDHGGPVIVLHEVQSTYASSRFRFLN